MKIAKYVIASLVVVAVVASVMSSFFAWHQPETPKCIA